jgi:hypothetical protein
MTSILSAKVLPDVRTFGTSHLRPPISNKRAAFGWTLPHERPPSIKPIEQHRELLRRQKCRKSASRGSLQLCVLQFEKRTDPGLMMP